MLCPWVRYFIRVSTDSNQGESSRHDWKIVHWDVKNQTKQHQYEGGSICNENPSITPSTIALGSYAICQTKDQSVAVKMVHETLFYLSKFNKLHTF